MNETLNKVFGYVIFILLAFAFAMVVKSCVAPWDTAAAAPHDTPQAALGTPTMRAIAATATMTPTATQNAILAASQTAVSLQTTLVSNAASMATVAAANAQETQRSGIITATAVYIEGAATATAKAAFVSYEATRAAVSLTLQAQEQRAAMETQWGWAWYVAFPAAAVFLAAAVFVAAWNMTTARAYEQHAEMTRAQAERDAMKRAPLTRNPAPQYLAEEKPRVVSINTGPDGQISGTFDELPCSDPQMTILAHFVINKGKRLGVNFWSEGKNWPRKDGTAGGAPFTRTEIENVAQWFVDSERAVKSGGEAVLNQQGRDWLADWLQNHPLPHS